MAGTMPRRDRRSIGAVRLLVLAAARFYRQRVAHVSMRRITLIVSVLRERRLAKAQGILPSVGSLAAAHMA